jgi:hypothetical protein
MSDIFKYIRSQQYSLRPQVDPVNSGTPDIVHKVRLKIIVKKLLGKQDTFGDTLESIMYSFDVVTNENGELVIAPRRLSAYGDIT